MDARRWWQKDAVIAWAIILFFPLGLYLMWKYAPWRNRFKWTWSLLVPFVALVVFSAAVAEEPPPDENIPAGQVVGTEPTEAVTSPAPSASASRTPETTRVVLTPTATTSSPVPSPSPVATATATASPASVSDSPSQNTAVQSPATSTAPVQPGATTALVVRVIDGDTIELQGGARVRYIGIDTPEATSVQECFGQEATARNRQLVEGKTVTLEKDVSETDRYGRLLRYVYVDGLMVNEVLALEGFAQVSTYPPDVKYQDRFLAAQRSARDANRGFWAGCITVEPTPIPAVVPQLPTQPGSAACPQGCSVAPEGCVIKGNISQNTGEKIYHVPGGGSYSATVITPSAGERWFCTEQEALANGWRKARN